MGFEGKVVLITGGSQGIGVSLVSAFYAQNAKVYFTGRNEDKLIKAKSGIESSISPKGSLNYLVGDVSNLKSAEELIAKVVSESGRIDILINNAGITKDNLILRMKEDEWDEVLSTNLKGVFCFTKSALKYMIRQKNGKIINISSVVGSMGNAGQANYCASKSGIEGFTRAVAREVGSRNITVNAIAPGYIVTPMTDNLPEDVKKSMLTMVPLGRFGLPDDIAKSAVFLASSNADYITGQVLHVNGGMYM